MSRKTNQEKPRRVRADPQTGSALRARALRLLARREHSRRELERKLAPHAPDPEEVAALLDELARSGWLSEQRLVEQVAHARRGRFGSRRIRQVLLDKGVAEAEIAGAMPELRAGDLEAARAVWSRMFGRPARNHSERARQVRYLRGRGFALDTIMVIIKSAGEDDGNT